ncbi:ATP-dependent RNA helicase DBP3 [Leucoagaricus sp. SymC.cos]|nr:ATP-dependent RNA helicase DBP3 [Leucoagaricus sp. SymC.cos]
MLLGGYRPLESQRVYSRSVNRRKKKERKEKEEKEAPSETTANAAADADAMDVESQLPTPIEKKKSRKRKHSEVDEPEATNLKPDEKVEKKKKKRDAEQFVVEEGVHISPLMPKASDPLPAYIHSNSGSALPPSDSEVKAFLQKHTVTITTPDDVPPVAPVVAFDQLDIPDGLRNAFVYFKEPSPIQACTWPPALEGRDIVGIAETGSGKTLAFGIPALSRLIRSPPKPQKYSTVSVLVVAPTRELAIQTHETLSALGKPFSIASVAVFGGVPKDPQIKMLKNASKGKDGMVTRIVVGTPGRILDLKQEGACDLSGVDYLVLDEADRMLDKGFENDIRNIISSTKPMSERQTMMFSATWPEAVRRLASSFQRNPVRVTVGSDDLTANSRVEQILEVFDDARSKDQRLLATLRSLSHKKTAKAGSTGSRILVFALYKKEASRVEQMLQRQGYAVCALHGDMSQNARMEMLESFKSGNTNLMVATDVAARGLDIPNVSAVINYTFPLTIEDYIHRIGRTGRGGKNGKSITFFTGDNHERSLAGEFAKVLREGGFDYEALKKFPMTIKKKEHSVYGAFYRDDIPASAGLFITDLKPDEKVEKKKKKRDAEQFVVEEGVHISPLMPKALPPSDSEVKAFLQKHNVTITTPDDVPPVAPVVAFDQLNIPDGLRDAFVYFKEPSPIQACTWPPALEGRDIVGIAETGSGKTLAFGIPALSRLIRSPPKPQKYSTVSVLVVAPTRELAIQTHETLSALGKPFSIASVAVFGGVPKDPQIKMLKNASKGKDGMVTRIVVGTPGRILDLKQEGACDLSGVDYLVLDEADRMLDKGFENDIRNIISSTKPMSERQTMMFSATWPEAVRRLASSFQRNPVRVTVGSDDLTANSRVEQILEVFDDARSKDQRLLATLRSLSHKKTAKAGSTGSRILVFALYKKEASRVEQMLQRQGYAVCALHGDMSQNARMEMLESFKSGNTNLMVATDVAARGLDIPNVSAVINYTFPLTIEDYIHRIGRTGRGGKNGKSITFFTGDNHERSLAGEFAKVLREGGFDYEALKKFPMTIKKKEHSVYGAFYRDDIPASAGPKKIVF